MVDKPPPRFAPEGARFRRPDWAPEGSQADRQKRTYVDRIGDLEAQIRGLQADVEGRDAEIIDLQKQLGVAALELGRAEGRNDKLTAELDAFHQDRKGDADRIEALQENLGHINDERLRLQANLEILKKEHSDLRGQSDRQATALADTRKLVAGARTKLIAIVVLGVAGTIWGSLGNPLPSFSHKDADAKLAVAKRAECVLQARAKAGNLGRAGTTLVGPLRWLPGRPENLLQTRDVTAPLYSDQFRMTNFVMPVSKDYSNAIRIAADVTNLSPYSIRSVSGTAYVMSLFDDGSCKPIMSQYFSIDANIAPQSSGPISKNIDVPDSAKSDEVFITDLMISF